MNHINELALVCHALEIAERARFLALLAENGSFDEKHPFENDEHVRKLQAECADAALIHGADASRRAFVAERENAIEIEKTLDAVARLANELVRAYARKKAARALFVLETKVVFDHAARDFAALCADVAMRWGRGPSIFTERGAKFKDVTVNPVTLP